MCQFDLQLFRRGRWLAACAVIAIDVAVMAPAFAAEDEEPAQLQEVVVTGSRIAAPNLTSTSPIQVISSKTIQQTGKNDVSDILLQLPQNFNNSRGQDLTGSTSGHRAPRGSPPADLP